MSGLIEISIKYIRHLSSARYTRGHGIHSPFVFHFTQFVIYEKNPFYSFSKIEKLREELRNDNRTISVTDCGTGESGKRKLNSIARKALMKSKYAQLLFRIVNNQKSKVILELGTSLGITTAYLASPHCEAKCITMEGCGEIARIAQQNFEKLQLNNVEIVVGDIDEKLSSVLAREKKIDLLLIDANHRSEAVLNYFEKCLSCMDDNAIVIVDDIYWSKDMEYAWEEIKKHKRTTATMDLFQMGIVFFSPDLERKNYKICF